MADQAKAKKGIGRRPLRDIERDPGETRKPTKEIGVMEALGADQQHMKRPTSHSRSPRIPGFATTVSSVCR